MTGAAPEQLPVDHGGRTDAGAGDEEHRIADPDRRPVGELTEQRGAGVVLHRRPHAEPLDRPAREVDALQVGVLAVGRDEAGSLTVDHPGTAMPTRIRSPVGSQLLGHRRDGVEIGRLRTVGDRPGGQHHAVADPGDLQGGSAEVETQGQNRHEVTLPSHSVDAI